MNVTFEQLDAEHRSYKGISLSEEECREHLQNAVKDNLLDREEWQDSLNRLQALQEETGFIANAGLIADIQTLLNEEIELKQFRIGEAYAEIILEQEFVCRFHWNENRDARNPRGNKTGADLVGFTEVNGEVVFLFGEVKTSSETATRPPQVMTYAEGIEKQLRDLYNDRNKRFILISYLKNKMRHYPDGHPFKIDFNASERSYYSDTCNFQLYGVLVRDVESDVKDLSASYERLKNHILEPNGLKLLALYLPIRKEEWENIINE
ncbi:hypothetical protein BBI01_17835 [Chryseobacterium artocarpi]|uniref:Anti-bacteriophage protein A/HamA C-terminal domain-containing protein n=1 Tax=Chryseobacterium artocarpi TaxID=1414727 RepID=A0A1B8ZBT5_9FLAO|nr:hypothetical protein [Chryseobacterium artocarpi]OCA69073.1 hypothetical protein BBI01_17835 [Chryseobacterium artocarpi]